MALVGNIFGVCSEPNDMMKQLAILFTCLVCNTIVKAQQSSQYSLHAYNPYFLNDAFNGIRSEIDLTAGFRKQWVGLNGSPLQFYFSSHMSLNNINSGIGLAAEYDQIGTFTHINTKLTYSYIFKINQVKLSIGPGLRINTSFINGEAIITPTGNYENPIDHNDPILPTGLRSNTSFGINGSIYVYHEMFESGVSVININNPSIDLSPSFQFQNGRYIHANLLFKIPITDEIKIKPSVFFRSDLIQSQIDFITRASYQDRFEFGIGFRGYTTPSVDAVIIMAGMQITDQLMCAYAYDISVGALQGFNSGSHELVIRYRIDNKLFKPLPHKIIYNTRYF